MSDDLQERVEQAAQGIPQTKPDERRRFLGSLRERSYLRMDNTEVQDEQLTALFLKHIEDYRPYTVLVNAHLPNQDFLMKIEAACSKHDVPFTLVNNESARTGAQDTAVLVAAKTAINRMRIDIKHVYPPELPQEKLENQQKSTGFWHRLFHRS